MAQGKMRKRRRKGFIKRASKRKIGGEREEGKERKKGRKEEVEKGRKMLNERNGEQMRTNESSGRKNGE